MSVLEQLVAEARQRARLLPRAEPASRPEGVRFDDALRGREHLSVIAEFKQASPSRGRIARRDPDEQARRYVTAGASAVSVLTEPTHFGGSMEHLELVVRAVEVPVLMKDFVVDPAQIRMAAASGARAVLLIVRCLSAEELEELASAAVHYGLVPLVECHDEDELERALATEGAVVGVNNRDLGSLEIDRRRATRLLPQVPADRVAVAESGYESAEDTRELRGLADAVLMGSALMKHEDPGGLIRSILA